MNNKNAEMKKKITGLLSEVNRIEPSDECKEYKELTRIRNHIRGKKSTLTQKQAGIPLRIAGKDVTVEVAEGPLEELKGLSGRDFLPDNHGMLFKRADGFWMRGVNFDLDIVFADRGGKILDIQTMTKLSADDYPTIYTPKDPNATIAVELPAGWCKRNKITEGDIITTGESDASKT